MSALTSSSTIATGPRWIALDAWAIALRTLLQWRRQPWGIAMGLAFPILLVVINAFIYGGAMSLPGGGDYREFLLPGMFAMTMLFGVTDTALAVNTDSEKGVTDRFRAMPMSPSAVVLGRSIADLLFSIMQLAIMMITGLVIGWEWHRGVGSALVAVGLLLLLRFAMIWMGIYLGLVVTSPEGVAGMQILIFPIAFLSSAFVLPETMPRVLQVVAEWNPLSSTAVASRSLFGNPGTGGESWVVENAPLMAILWPVALVGIFLPLSIRAWRGLGH